MAGTLAGDEIVGAFGNEQPNTSFVFVNGSNAGYMADIIAHEAGHSFGLGHQEVYHADGSLADAYADGDSSSTPLMGSVAIESSRTRRKCIRPSSREPIRTDFRRRSPGDSNEDTS